MSGQQLPTAHSDSLNPASANSGQDWAIWLRHACQLRLPTAVAFPGRAEAAWTALTHLARRQGFNVERANCAAADGLTTWRNRTIRIRPDIASPQAVIALAHQLGHVLLHSQIAHLERSGTVPCTGIRKVEADSVAYLTALSTGIDTTAITFPTGSSWAGSDPRARPATTIKAVTARIRTAAAAINAMLDAAGVTRPPSATTPGATLQRVRPSVPAEQIIRAHDSAAAFFRSHVQRSWVPAHLASRGLGTEVQEHWLTGYAPAAWDALTSHLRADGYRDTVIEAAGLARRSRRGTLIDTFRDRAMLPIRSPDGTIVAFIGRAPSHAAAATPKYLNSPSTSVYSKSTVLLGLWEGREALANGARPVLVEGPFDAIAVTIAGSGRHVGVAPCGTALTDRQVALLAQAADLRAAGVSVAFDPDQAGRRAAVHAYHLLVPLTASLAAVSLPRRPGPGTRAGPLRTRRPGRGPHRKHPPASRPRHQRRRRTVGPLAAPPRRPDPCATRRRSPHRGHASWPRRPPGRPPRRDPPARPRHRHQGRHRRTGRTDQRRAKQTPAGRPLHRTAGHPACTRNVSASSAKQTTRRRPAPVNQPHTQLARPRPTRAF